MIDRVPTVVYCYNRLVRAATDDENAIVVGEGVAVRRAGRVTWARGDLIADEFADLASSYDVVPEETDAKERKGMKLRVMPFFTGIGDCSYMVCADPAAERELMGHMTLAGAAYDIPFEAAHQLVAPCFFIGPRCRDIHRWEERVYVPDLTENVPEIIEELLR